MVDYWQDLWANEPPVLELRPGDLLVDTRPKASEQETILDPGCVMALDYLRKPRTRARLAVFLKENGLSGSEIASVERFLDDRQLLFEEGRHVISVVTGTASVFPRRERVDGAGAADGYLKDAGAETAL